MDNKIYKAEMSSNQVGSDSSIHVYTLCCILHQCAISLHARHLL